VFQEVPIARRSASTYDRRCIEESVMFARIISLVLIAAVIACPLSCGSGVCHADQCCADRGCVSEEQCSQAVCAGHATTDGDCCAESSHDRGEPIPAPCPAKSSCQGICGGAVIEKPCKLGSPGASFIHLQPGNDHTFVFQLSVCRTTAFEFPECVRAGNQGRFVRTLHMSLNC